MVLCGGLGAVKEIDEECRAVLRQVRAACEEKVGKKFTRFDPVEYKTQLVNGINFFIKTKISDSEYIHVRAHKAFLGAVSLWGVQTGKSLQDELVHFQ